MDRGTAIRALPYKRLSTHCTELPADRICRGTVWPAEIAAVHAICMVRGAMRIWTEAARRGNKVNYRRRIRNSHAWLFPGFKADSKFLRKLRHRFVVKLCTIPLLKHRQCGLLAADFRSNSLLRKLRRFSRIADLYANFWTKPFHWRVLWTLFYKLSRANYKHYKHNYKLINSKRFISSSLRLYPQ